MATVLVIEDNPDIRENMCELLDLAGYTSIYAQDGTGGIEAAARHLPDIILCDVLMPDIDGYEVFNRLKNNVATACIPFVFVTANAEKINMQTGLAMGARAYVRKPFDIDELLQTVASCL